MKSRARSQPFYEKAVAVCVAFAVEGVLLTAFLLQPANRRMIHSQGGGMVVTILGHGSETGAAPAQPRSLAQNLLEDVQRRMAPTYIAMPLDRGRAPPRSLSDFFGNSAGRSGEAAPASAQADLNRLAQQAAGQLGDPRAQASVPHQPQFDKEGKALPCWRQPDRPIPVKVIVVLDARGVMVGRPVIDRAPGAPGGAIDEQEAMRAMAGCSPYRYWRKS